MSADSFQSYYDDDFGNQYMDDIDSLIDDDLDELDPGLYHQEHQMQMALDSPHLTPAWETQTNYHHHLAALDQPQLLSATSAINHMLESPTLSPTPPHLSPPSPTALRPSSLPLRASTATRQRSRTVPAAAPQTSGGDWLLGELGYNPYGFNLALASPALLSRIVVTGTVVTSTVSRRLGAASHEHSKSRLVGVAHVRAATGQYVPAGYGVATRPRGNNIT